MYHSSANLIVGKFVFLLGQYKQQKKVFKNLIRLCTLYFVGGGEASYTHLMVGQTKCSELFKPVRSKPPNSPEKSFYNNLIYLSRYVLNKYMWTNIYI